MFQVKEPQITPKGFGLYCVFTLVIVAGVLLFLWRLPWWRARSEQKEADKKASYGAGTEVHRTSISSYDQQDKPNGRFRSVSTPHRC